MTDYIVESEFKVRQYDTATITAVDVDEAAQFATEAIFEANDDVSDVEIVSVKEVVTGV